MESNRFRDNLNIRCHIVVDALLSLGRLYFGYLQYIGFSGQRSVGQAGQAPHRHLTLHLGPFGHIFGAVRTTYERIKLRWHADASDHMIIPLSGGKGTVPISFRKTSRSGYC
jgi:hypothetical protein